MATAVEAVSIALRYVTKQKLPPPAQMAVLLGTTYDIVFVFFFVRNVRK
jgi:hypothetical protein